MRTKLYVGVALIVFTLIFANVIAFGTLPNLLSGDSTKLITTVNKSEDTNTLNQTIISNQNTQTETNKTTQTTSTNQQTPPTQTIIVQPSPPKPKITRAS